jgi:hypothetical protein
MRSCVPQVMRHAVQLEIGLELTLDDVGRRAAARARAAGRATAPAREPVLAAASAGAAGGASTTTTSSAASMKRRGTVLARRRPVRPSTSACSSAMNSRLIDGDDGDAGVEQLLTSW